MGKGNGQGLKIISKIKFIQYPQGRIQEFLTAGGMGNTKINRPNFFYRPSSIYKYIIYIQACFILQRGATG